VKRRIVLLGAPGAGKGTQARVLAGREGLAHLSTGDLLRAAVAAGSPAGKAAKAHMDAGRLVPDDVVFGVLFERLDARTTGFVLDGFPRNVAQAEELDRRLAALKLPLEAVVDIDVPDSRLVARITGRRACKTCGRNYHVQFLPPRRPGICDDDGAPLVQRADDTEAVVKERLDVYHRQAAPLKDYYRARGLLSRVDGDREPAAVERDLLACLGGAAANAGRRP
jgi:adenylate kinase